MAIKAVIFDLDGTIWDSYPCYGAALDAPLKLAVGKSAILLSGGENILSLAKKADLGRTCLSRLCMENISKLQLFPGVTEGLRQLYEDGVLLGVATNLPGWFVKPFLSHFKLEKLFKAHAFAAGKPKPNALNNVVEELKVPKTDTFFIGDNEVDALAANAAGVPFAWASWGYGTKPSVNHTRIDQFKDVLCL